MHKNILPGSGWWGVVSLTVGTGLDVGTGDKGTIDLGHISYFVSGWWWSKY